MAQEKDTTVKFMLRLPDGWRSSLKAAAAQNGRSLNSEILQRLKPSVELTEAAESAA
ncbi:Arc family DNA-binding protein [Thioclava electrotropha]|uniref:Arc family DNA-binding protein n=1 Tax=Thioclava electrotropha TaxID=1549850 RepID=A0ABX6YRJ9_9RHOB|nr:Arc family DNA-binding protein [Thioclava electrotropha]QPZ89969.1 Arc family DNA-binding protein [Thioclava electrotropha]